MLMPRTFNTAGPNKADIHYTLDSEARLPIVRSLIEQQNYFVMHAPRQTGKTTLFDTLARKLTAEGRYTAIHFSIEASRPFSKDAVAAVANAVDSLRWTAKAVLPEALQPADEIFTSISEPSNGLLYVLHRWAETSPRPLVIFLDEIDAIEAEALISILHQLRNGYKLRPQNFPHSLALIGMRDVREYRAHVRPERESLGSASPFNIKAESLTLANFSLEEVTRLYRQHTEETGQAWQDEAVLRAYDLTRGQPWLVNALARQVVEQEAADRAVAIAAAHLEAAKEVLILRRDTHLDSLAERMHEPRVRRVIEPILTGDFPEAEIYNDDLLYAADLGLITRPPQHVRIANPIYAEVIPRALSYVMQSILPIEAHWYIMPDGRLDMSKLLAEFQQFYREHSAMWLERYAYKEAGPHLLLYAWLQRIINGGGHLARESAIGAGRVDLLVEWPVTKNPAQRRWPIPAGVKAQKEAMEVKVYRDRNTTKQGLEQLGRYLTQLGEKRGHLLVFDRRAKRNRPKKVFQRKNVPLPSPYKKLRATIWGM